MRRWFEQQTPVIVVHHDEYGGIASQEPPRTLARATRNAVVFTDGARLRFRGLRVNYYGNDQLMLDGESFSLAVERRP